MRAMTALPYHGENKHIKDVKAAGSFHAASSPAGTINQPTPSGAAPKPEAVER